MFHSTVKNGRSCFVSNNTYDVYEAPKIGQRQDITGEFFVLAHNSSYDYWIAAIMTDKLKGQSEQIHYEVLGKYTISSDGEKTILSKELNGKEINYGDNTLSKFFDQFNIRRKAYGKTRADIIAENNEFRNDISKIKNRNSIVRIYKKKK